MARMRATLHEPHAGMVTHKGIATQSRAQRRPLLAPDAHHCSVSGTQPSRLQLVALAHASTLALHWAATSVDAYDCRTARRVCFAATRPGRRFCQSRNR